MGAAKLKVSVQEERLARKSAAKSRWRVTVKLNHDYLCAYASHNICVLHCFV